MGEQIQFLNVHQKDITHRSLAEQLQAQFEEKNPQPSQIKVNAKFWNSRTGAEENRTDLSSVQKQKHQINSLAVSAAAMEVELARQRQAGYAKRDSARKKYGEWCKESSDRMASYSLRTALIRSCFMLLFCVAVLCLGW